MRRIINDRRVTPEEAAKYNKIREQVTKEFPKSMRNHQNAVEALIYLADCSAATCEHMACLKSISASEFTRHVGITRIAIMAAQKYSSRNPILNEGQLLVKDYKDQIGEVQIRLDQAIEDQNTKIYKKKMK